MDKVHRRPREAINLYTHSQALAPTTRCFTRRFTTTNNFRLSGLGIERFRRNLQADESKRKQGVEQQMKLREQLLKTGEVQRQLMKLQNELAGEKKRPGSKTTDPPQPPPLR